ncbi:hypothetical protein J6590_025488 [Homalodisca vitripennis]|nr:hypothetical protein J6590_025488 [Homalodisca vitripennis]
MSTVKLLANEWCLMEALQDLKLSEGFEEIQGGVRSLYSTIACGHARGQNRSQSFWTIHSKLNATFRLHCHCRRHSPRTMTPASHGPRNGPDHKGQWFGSTTAYITEKRPGEP